MQLLQRINHTWDEYYHRKRTFIERQTRYKQCDTELRKTSNQGKFRECLNVKQLKRLLESQMWMKSVKKSVQKNLMWA